MKLIIQIPCLNEAETLPATLADLPRPGDVAITAQDQFHVMLEVVLRRQGRRLRRRHRYVVIER